MVNGGGKNCAGVIAALTSQVNHDGKSLIEAILRSAEGGELVSLRCRGVEREECKADAKGGGSEGSGVPRSRPAVCDLGLCLQRLVRTRRA